MTSLELAHKLLKIGNLPIFVQGYEYGLTEIIEDNIQSVKVIREANPNAILGGRDSEDWHNSDHDSIPAILLKR